MKHSNFDDSFDEDEDYGPSKSQLKREMHALQDLGETLCGLPLKVVSEFELNESLFSAYQAAQTIHSNSAKKRHRQFVGKVLRKLPEEELEKLKKHLQDYANRHHRQTESFHHIEVCRDKILAGGDKAINEVLSTYPFLERSYLRQLVRNANKEKERQQAPKSARLLFKYLKENITDQ